MEKKRSKSTSPHKFNLSIFNRTESADSNDSVLGNLKEISVTANLSIDNNYSNEKKSSLVNNEIIEKVASKGIELITANDNTTDVLPDSDIASGDDFLKDQNEKKSCCDPWQGDSIESKNTASSSESNILGNDGNEELGLNQNKKHFSRSPSCAEVDINNGKQRLHKNQALS